MSPGVKALVNSFLYWQRRCFLLLKLEEVLKYKTGWPLWQDMLDYLEMPHHDNFGVEVLKLYRSARTAVIALAGDLARIPGNRKVYEAFNVAADEYRSVCDAIYELFEREHPAVVARATPGNT
jgi:hypothetical protein